MGVLHTSSRSGSRDGVHPRGLCPACATLSNLLCARANGEKTIHLSQEKCTNIYAKLRNRSKVHPSGAAAVIVYLLFKLATKYKDSVESNVKSETGNSSSYTLNIRVESRSGAGRPNPASNPYWVKSMRRNRVLTGNLSLMFPLLMALILCSCGTSSPALPPSARDVHGRPRPVLNSCPGAPHTRFAAEEQLPLALRGIAEPGPQFRHRSAQSRTRRVEISQPVHAVLRNDPTRPQPARSPHSDPPPGSASCRPTESVKCVCHAYHQSPHAS